MRGSKFVKVLNSARNVNHYSPAKYIHTLRGRKRNRSFITVLDPSPHERSLSKRVRENYPRLNMVDQDLGHGTLLGSSKSFGDVLLPREYHWVVDSGELDKKVSSHDFRWGFSGIADTNRDTYRLPSSNLSSGSWICRITACDGNEFHSEPRALILTHLFRNNSDAVLLLMQLTLQDGNLLRSSAIRFGRFVSCLPCGPTQQIGLSGHFLELLEDEPCCYTGRSEGDASNYQSPISKADSFLLEPRKLFVFNNFYAKWLSNGALFLLAIGSLKGAGDLLLEVGWNLEIERRFRFISGRGFTDREGVFLGVGGAIVFVWCIVQFLTNVSQWISN